MNFGELTSETIHAQYSGLNVCGTCGNLGGTVQLKGDENAPRVLQTCTCDPTPFDVNNRWPGFDYNRAAALCYCCGQILLGSGSRWSVWFCDGCKEQVRWLNARLGRYSLPIGPHSMMGGFGLQGDATSVDALLFCESWNGILGAMKSVGEWSGRIVLDILEERWNPVPDRMPIESYLARCVTTEAEQICRFRGMMDFLSESHTGQASASRGRREED